MTYDEAIEKLSQPFPPEDIHWRIAVVTGDRAMVVAELAVEAIRRRFDEVLGPQGFMESQGYAGGLGFKCDIEVMVDSGRHGRWAWSDISKDDAFRKTAVKYRVGDYIDQHPPQWVSYDPLLQRILEEPEKPVKEAQHA